MLRTDGSVGRCHDPPHDLPPRHSLAADVAIDRRRRDADKGGEIGDRYAFRGDVGLQVHAPYNAVLVLISHTYTKTVLDASRYSTYQFGMTPLARVMKKRGISQAKLAEMAGTSQPQIQRLAAGVREMSKEWALRLAPLLDVPPQDLIFGPGKSGTKPRLVSSFDPDEPEAADAHDEAAKSATGRGHRLTPGAIAEIDVRAGAGGGGFATVHAVSDGSVTYAGDAVRAEWILPQSFVRDELHLSFGRTEIIPIRGDSMEPDLKDGDRVIVDRTDVNLRQGGIFAVLDAGELIVKQVELVRGSEPPQIVCKSRNPNYSPITLTLDEGTAVIGRVAAKISRM